MDKQRLTGMSQQPRLLLALVLLASLLALPAFAAVGVAATVSLDCADTADETVHGAALPDCPQLCIPQHQAGEAVPSSCHGHAPGADNRILSVLPPLPVTKAIQPSPSSGPPLFLRFGRLLL